MKLTALFLLILVFVAGLVGAQRSCLGHNKPCKGDPPCCHGYHCTHRDTGWKCGYATASDRK
ncbi:U12-theraphotoxin-Cg1a-like isoform X2 [Homalodisca vitripennis]|uniref:U12-theraphotoxin-Cg1a-like isoform X2 n=1 Tax=Homalodisca vitripennis TaxID=197043 RepID=UPI001EEA3A9A|nr:U12-theraphotoxin-Cg1a-like isoform X2 [Homalodisca vitripennis]